MRREVRATERRDLPHRALRCARGCRRLRRPASQSGCARRRGEEGRQVRTPARGRSVDRRRGPGVPRRHCRSPLGGILGEVRAAADMLGHSLDRILRIYAAHALPSRSAPSPTRSASAPGGGADVTDSSGRGRPANWHLRPAASAFRHSPEFENHALGRVRTSDSVMTCRSVGATCGRDAVEQRRIGDQVGDISAA